MSSLLNFYRAAAGVAEPEPTPFMQRTPDLDLPAIQGVYFAATSETLWVVTERDLAAYNLKTGLADAAKNVADFTTVSSRSLGVLGIFADGSDVYVPHHSNRGASATRNLRLFKYDTATRTRKTTSAVLPAPVDVPATRAYGGRVGGKLVMYLRASPNTIAVTVASDGSMTAVQETSDFFAGIGTFLAVRRGSFYSIISDDWPFDGTVQIRTPGADAVAATHGIDIGPSEALTSGTTTLGRKPQGTQGSSAWGYSAGAGPTGDEGWLGTTPSKDLFAAFGAITGAAFTAGSQSFAIRAMLFGQGGGESGLLMLSNADNAPSGMYFAGGNDKVEISRVLDNFAGRTLDGASLGDSFPWTLDRLLYEQPENFNALFLAGDTAYIRKRALGEWLAYTLNDPPVFNVLATRSTRVAAIPANDGEWTIIRPGQTAVVVRGDVSSLFSTGTSYAVVIDDGDPVDMGSLATVGFSGGNTTLRFNANPFNLGLFAFLSSGTKLQIGTTS